MEIFNFTTIKIIFHSSCVWVGVVELPAVVLAGVHWTELTEGKVQSLDADGNVVNGQWLGSGSNGEYAPVSCTVDNEPVEVGEHIASCGFGIDDAVGVNCLN